MALEYSRGSGNFMGVLRTGLKGQSYVLQNGNIWRLTDTGMTLRNDANYLPTQGGISLHS